MLLTTPRWERTIREGMVLLQQQKNPTGKRTHTYTRHTHTYTHAHAHLHIQIHTDTHAFTGAMVHACTMTITHSSCPTGLMISAVWARGFGGRVSPRVRRRSHNLGTSLACHFISLDTHDLGSLFAWQAVHCAHHAWQLIGLPVHQLGSLLVWQFSSYAFRFLSTEPTFMVLFVGRSSAALRIGSLWVFVCLLMVQILCKNYHVVAKSRSASPTYFKRIRGTVDRRRIFLF